MNLKTRRLESSCQVATWISQTFHFKGFDSF
jgi:hypothetical protein